MDVLVDERCHFTSIHKLITFKVPGKKDKVRKKICFRNKSNFNPSEYVEVVINKINELLLTRCNHTEVCKSECIECLMEVYNYITRIEYENRCPEIEKNIVVVDKSPWFNGETLSAKKEKRRKENIWLRKKTEETWLAYCTARNQYNYLIRRTKISYYRRKIADAANDMTKLYCLLNGLTGDW